MKKYIAFTLAEVLITLSILGVVAAVTIPSIQRNYNNIANVTALKKAYATLSSATAQVEMEHGKITKPEYTSSNIDDKTLEYFSYITDYLKYNKKCLSKDGYCWNNNKKQGFIMTLKNDKHYLETPNSKYILIKMADGSRMYFKNMAYSNAGSYEKLKYYDVTSNSYKWRNDNPAIIVDVNGEKGPNMYGRDTFVFFLTSKGLVPLGIENSDDCTKNGNGFTCAGRVLKEGGIHY